MNSSASGSRQPPPHAMAGCRRATRSNTTRAALQRTATIGHRPCQHGHPRGGRCGGAMVPRTSQRKGGRTPRARALRSGTHRQESLTRPESATIDRYRYGTAPRHTRGKSLPITRLLRAVATPRWLIAPRRSPVRERTAGNDGLALPANRWPRKRSLIGTSRRARSPKPAPNQPDPKARRTRSRAGNMAICRLFAALAGDPRLPENRGVPGSSPGLAIAGNPCKADASCRAVAS
jgi:hypothetical protein